MTCARIVLKWSPPTIATRHALTWMQGRHMLDMTGLQRADATEAPLRAFVEAEHMPYAKCPLPIRQNPCLADMDFAPSRTPAPLHTLSNSPCRAFGPYQQSPRRRDCFVGAGLAQQSRRGRCSETAIAVLPGASGGLGAGALQVVKQLHRVAISCQHARLHGDAPSLSV